MDLINWIPSITITSLLALALWLSRRLIETRLTRSVEHEFSKKLETVRSEFREKEELLKADLRSKETEIAHLRTGVLTAIASRQMALDRRRLQAVDQLWSAVTALGRAKIISSFMSVIKFEASAKETAKNPRFREVFEVMSLGLDPQKIDLTSSAKARPFVSPMAWAIFSAYQAIAMQAVLKLQMLKTGTGAKDFIDKDAVAKLVKASLPHHAEYIDKFGDAGYHYLLDDLEGRLLEEMRKMLAGFDTDKASMEQAAEILKLSNDLIESAKQSTMPPNTAFQGTPGNRRP